jgi:hypothetical protein
MKRAARKPPLSPRNCTVASQQREIVKCRRIEVSTLKRSIYGRAGAELIRARMLPAPLHFQHARARQNGSRHRGARMPEKE